MPQVEIVGEQEVGPGWRFHVQVLGDDGSLHRCRLSLAWADYNLWSASGADEPARVAAAVIDFLLARRGLDALRSTFDAAIVRRLEEDADREIPGWIR